MPVLGHGSMFLSWDCETAVTDCLVLGAVGACYVCTCVLVSLKLQLDAGYPPQSLSCLF